MIFLTLNERNYGKFNYRLNVYTVIGGVAVRIRILD